MSNPNLHPVWIEVLGIEPATTRSANAATTPSPLAAAIAAMTGSRSHDWQVTNHLRVPGAPVGIKKQLGPGLWASTVAMPGDAYYPVHS